MIERVECSKCNGLIPHEDVRVREQRDKRIGLHRRTIDATCPHCHHHARATHQLLNGVWCLAATPSESRRGAAR